MEMRSFFSYEGFRQGDNPCEITMHHLPDGYAMHRHDYLEIVMVLAGSADHQVDDRAYHVGAGDVFVIQGDTRHGYNHASPDFSLCNIFYPQDSPWLPQARLRALAGYQALFVLEPARRREQDFPSRLRLSALELHELQRLVLQLRDELARQEAGYQLIAQGLLLHLIIALSRAYTRLKDERATGLLRLGEVMIYMEEHLSEPIAMAELAARASTSERHFYRLFHQHFGVSPSRRLLELRIRQACRLLAERELNITEIAYACGFRDSNYFTRQFQRLTGSTPRAFRKGQLARGSAAG